MTLAPVNINLEDFLRTGVFGPVDFGMTSEMISAFFGPPDFIFTGHKRRSPRGLKYGDVEFHFSDAKDACLRAIYLDHFSVPQGGGLLNLDSWFLRGAAPQETVAIALTNAGISFQQTEMPDPSMAGILTTSGVTLGFIQVTEAFSPPVGLYNIFRGM